MPGLVVAPGLTPGGNAAGAALAGVRPAPQNGTGTRRARGTGRCQAARTRSALPRSRVHGLGFERVVIVIDPDVNESPIVFNSKMGLY